MLSNESTYWIGYREIYNFKENIYLRRAAHKSRIIMTAAAAVTRAERYFFSRFHHVYIYIEHHFHVCVCTQTVCIVMRSDKKKHNLILLFFFYVFFYVTAIRRTRGTKPEKVQSRA